MLTYAVRLSTLIREKLARDEEGATAVEYGLIVSLIAAAIVAVVTQVGQKLVGTFQNVITNLP